MHNLAKKISKCIETKVEGIGIENIDLSQLKELSEWVDIMKDISEYDKNMRIIEAMDESEDDDDDDGRMGYRGRDSRGRFVSRRGRGRSAGYTPIETGYAYPDYEYPVMGYPMGGGRGSGGSSSGNSSGNSSGSSSGKSGGSGYTDGMNGSYGYTQSRYGKSFEEYDRHRRAYTETKDPEHAKRMKESMNEYMQDAMDSMKEIWKNAEQADKQMVKQKLSQMVQQLQ